MTSFRVSARRYLLCIFVATTMSFKEVLLNTDEQQDGPIEIENGENKQNNNHNINNVVDTQQYTPNLSYCRPQHTFGKRRLIKVIDTEERKGRIAKHTVYIIECNPAPSGVVTVARRFNDFKWLQQFFGRSFPSIFVPPLPPSSLLGRFEDTFIEERRKDLERFLNRMEEVKCFSESLAFLMFLSRPESTLDLGKKEVESNINQRTDEDIAEELIHVFPHLRKQQLSDNAQNEDIPRLREFLQKLEMQMCVVNKSAMKLFHNLNSVALEMNGFHKAFDSLYVAEGNYPYKTNEHRLDVRKQFRDWAEFQTKQTDAYYDNFFRQLRYEHEDICSLLDLFRARDVVEKRYRKVCRAIDKWEEQESNGMQITKESHILQKRRDYQNRKQSKALLDIMSKIILKNEIHVIWNAKTSAWRDRIQKFAELQAQGTSKMLDDWKQIQNMKK